MAQVGKLLLHLGTVHRFENVAAGMQCQRVAGVLVITGHKNQIDGRVQLAQGLGQFRTVPSAHLNIKECHIHRVFLCIVHYCSRLGERHDLRLRTHIVDRPHQQLQCQRFVVYSHNSKP